MKRLNPVHIKIDTNMDSDDLGQRLVDCIREINTDNNVVNIVKIHLGDTIRLDKFNHIISECVARPLRDMGADNCIFVPIKKGFIEDITVECVEVLNDESNDRTD